MRKKRTTSKIWIFCCWEKWELQYFQDYKDDFRMAWVEVKRMSRLSPWQMIEGIVNFKKTEKYDSDDELWCVFDVDDFLAENPSEFQRGIKLAKKEKVLLAWSNECFELWLLMHFEYPLHIIWRDQYHNKLEKHFKKIWKLYKKNTPWIWNIIYEEQDIAITNAERLFTENPKIENNPSSTVFELIKKLRERG